MGGTGVEQSDEYKHLDILMKMYVIKQKKKFGGVSFGKSTNHWIEVSSDIRQKIEHKLKRKYIGKRSLHRHYNN